MKKIIFQALLLVGVFFSATHTQAIVIGSGQTITMGNENIVSSIYIKDGGTLIVNGNLYMGFDFTSQLKIVIENGGRLISDNQNGKITGHNPEKFLGIIVEGTTYAGGNTLHALYLDGFSITGAELAIHILGNERQTVEGVDYINRKVFVANTNFSECKKLLFNSKCLHFNRDNSYNNITFESCYFESFKTVAYPIHLHFLNNLILDSCEFNIAKDFAVHFNMQRNAVIKDCQFTNPEAWLGLVFHRHNYNISITGNTFYGSGKESTYFGVGIGVRFHSGILHSGEIRDNIFYDCKVGVSIGDAGNNVQGEDGEADNLIISGNTFTDSKIGIQMSKSSALEVEDNSFNNCTTGLLFNGEDNIDPAVRCNTFSFCNTGIKNEDNTLNQFLTSHPNIDDNNLFFGLEGIDIHDSSSTFFLYNLRQGTYPGIADNTIGVNMILVAKRKRCGDDGLSLGEGLTINGDENEQTISSSKKEKELTLSIQPNPSIDGIIEVQVNSLTRAKISILDQVGRLLLEKSSNGNLEKIAFNLANFSPGIYFVKVQTGINSKTEKLIIQ